MAGYVWIAALAGLLAVTVPLARTDLAEKRLPNVYTLSLYIWGLSCAAALAIIERDVWRLLLPVGVSLAIAAVLLVSGTIARGGVGLGDVKLVAGTSLVLALRTWQTAVLAIALAFIVMAVRAIVAIVRGQATFESRLPFGPSILAGAWLAVVVAAL